MHQKNLLTQALGLIQHQQHHRWWLRAVTGMAAVVVFVTTYLLILPAITMENSSLEVSATPSQAALGEIIYSEIAATADDGRDETFFVLTVDGDNAGLDESRLNFDSDGVAVVETADGPLLELHRDYTEDGSARYWFVLQQGQSVHFDLPWVNGTDRYRAETVEELIPIEPEEPAAEEELPEVSEPIPSEPETPPAVSGSDETSPASPVETPPAETGSEPVQPSDESVPPEQPEEPDAAEPNEPGADAPNPEEAPAEQEQPSAEVQEPESPAAEESAPEPEETASPADDVTSQPDELDTDALATDSNAAFTAASVSHARFAPSPMRTVGASAVSLSRHEVPMTAQAYITATDSNLTLMEPDTNGQSDPESDGQDAEESVEYETVSRTEIVLDQSGDPEREGSLTLTFGCGKDKETAQRRAGDPIALSWMEEELSVELPEDATSWAIVEKDGFLPQSSNSAMMLPSSIGAAAPEQRNYDFSNDITSVTASKLQNGQWVPGTEFTDGDSVRVSIRYSLPANVVGAGNQTIYYDMPEGISLSNPESGTVYDNGTPVGTYTITTDGLITIVFDDSFADDRPFSGEIQFQGTLSAGEDGSETELNFGAGGTITVKPSTSPTDVQVKKEGEYNKADQKLHYTLTVSTTKGTGGKITVNDAFQSTNTLATYDRDSFQIIKVSANGQQTPVSGYAPVITTAWQGGPEQFTISGLPELAAGESYRISYTATPGKTTDALGASNVNNSLTVTTEGGDNGSGWNSITISSQMLKKWGNYDQASQTITWTITLNHDKRDISGWTLKDTITTPDGITAHLPDQVTLTGSDGTSRQITLPYTFPQGSDDSYTITYQTKVDGLKPGQQVTVSNKAELEGGGEHYESDSSTYPGAPDYGVSKNHGWHDTNNSNDSFGYEQWNTTIQVPGSVDLEQITYTDTLIGAATGGQPVEGSHYITAAQLGALTVKVDGVDLVRDTDYQICDGDGNVIRDFSSSTVYTGFQIKFLDAAKEKIAGKSVNLQYYTTVDYTMLSGGVIYTIRNIGAIPGHESEGETTWEKPKGLEKQASVSGTPGSYTDDGIDIDFTASGGVIHYRLLVKTDPSTKGDIILTDLLPAGATLQADTVKMMFYYNDYYQTDHISKWDEGGEHTYVAADHIHTGIGGKNEDGTTTVTFTIDDGYNLDGNTNILAVYYDVSIAGDPIWTDNPGLEEHLYTNKASWGTASVENDVTVNRDVPKLAKEGVQLPSVDAEGNPVLDAQGNPVYSNTVRYTVIINQGGLDLDPVRDVLELKDTLTLPGNAAGADLDVGSVHLYQYDAAAEDHLGQELNPARYSYVYDRDSHTLTFTIPDHMALVLVYEYAIDRGTAAGDLQLSNSAQLTGVADGSTGNQLQFQETSSSATVTKRTLTIYKVDAANYGKSLPGAQFKLESWANSSWTQAATLTTDENGQIVLDVSGGEQIYQEQTLYKLTETSAPTSYAPDPTPRYFVWIGESQTVETCKDAMRSTLQQAGVTENEVLFIANSSAIYVPNTSTTLTVQKVWVDENGGELANPGVDSVEVKLWQQKTETNGVTVTVNWTEQYGTSGSSSIQVASGSALTIDTLMYGQYTYSINGGPEISSNDHLLTLDRVDGDMTVILRFPYGISNPLGFSGYEEPYYIQTGEKTLYETVTLTAQNGWSYTWPSLPTVDGSGQPVYYTVEETGIPGFHVTYSPNNENGIQAGELVITNQSNGYLLPETGGAGTTLFTAGGLTFLALAGLMYIILRVRGRMPPLTRNPKPKQKERMYQRHEENQETVCHVPGHDYGCGTGHPRIRGGACNLHHHRPGQRPHL